MRILLAEDEAALSKAYAQVLIMQGYEVEPVYDGEAALEAANSGTYDLMIFDVMMPKMSGLEVLRALREAGNTTYVIMLTAIVATTMNCKRSLLNKSHLYKFKLSIFFS